MLLHSNTCSTTFFFLIYLFVCILIYLYTIFLYIIIPIYILPYFYDSKLSFSHSIVFYLYLSYSLTHSLIHSFSQFIFCKNLFDALMFFRSIQVLLVLNKSSIYWVPLDQNKKKRRLIIWLSFILLTFPSLQVHNLFLVFGHYILI